MTLFCVDRKRTLVNKVREGSHLGMCVDIGQFFINWGEVLRCQRSAPCSPKLPEERLPYSDRTMVRLHITRGKVGWAKRELQAQGCKTILLTKLDEGRCAFSDDIGEVFGVKNHDI